MQEYRIIASRVDVFGPGEVNKKPGAREQLVLISADGTKATVDNPIPQLVTAIEQAIANDREVTFTLRAGSTEAEVVTVGDTPYTF